MAHFAALTPKQAKFFEPIDTATLTMTLTSSPDITT